MSHVVRTTVATSISIALASLTLSALGTAPAGAATVQAPSAAAFRDSQGVATHFDFDGYAYAEEPIEALQSALRGVGIRHIRDHSCLDLEPVCLTVRNRIGQMADTFAPTGPKVGVMVIAAPLVGKPTIRAERDAEIARSLRGIRDSPLAAMAEGIEMVNEPDYKGGNWAAQTLADAQTFKRLLATDEFASLRSIPLIAPALGKMTTTPDLLAAGWTKDLAGVSNMHPYPMPYDTPEVTGIANICDAATGRTVAQCAVDLAQSDRAIATESGYSSAGTALVADWVSQKAQASYTTRMLLHNFKSGVPRTYLYELINLSSQQTDRNHGYGLLAARSSGGVQRLGGPKLVYLALQNLNERIGDLGAKALPGSIDLTITDPATGAEVPETTAEKVVLRRSDGKFILAVWQPAKVWRHVNYTPQNLTVPVKTIKVSLDGSQGGWNVKRFNIVPSPAEADDFQQEYTNTSSVEFGINGDVTLLELTPPAPLTGPVADPGEQPGTTVPENTIPGTTIVEPAKPKPTPVTAPSTDAPRPAEASQTAAQAGQTPGRAQAASARERANRLARARSRARRAYSACLDRQVSKAQRRKRASSARPRPSRPTKEMRARCGRWLAR